ncbi:phage portal protein [Halobacteria archaeon AArc-curdl1]|uniref:Phage portal protein n=1 Tax=Natronosalvus hydrolyticus TaxID=2979988 RepID=A0AAP2ZCL2_9EURY|nr:phage portal protein [Halobacteria archaeon AArc-curdl1]
MSLRDRIKHGSKNLTESILSRSEPGVQSENRRGQFGIFSHGDDIDSHTPNRGNLEKYQEQFETCPLVRIPIRMYAEDVTEPGYRVEADNDNLTEELENWLSQSAIVAGESHKDFSHILDGSIIQQEVRGTALVEVVPKAENPDEIWGFRLINVSTVNAYTYDDKAILVRPDDTELDGVNLTQRDEAAAYGQWDDGAYAGPFNDKETVYLSQNDIVKLVRDPDTSDVFGKSSIAPVSKEIDELNQMLNDLAEAVRSKGYPHWIFKLGEPNGDISNPRAGIWPEDKIKDLRDEHKGDNYSAGQKDFLPGDVEVETISSDVPEIEEILDWYVEDILSSMPTPKYKLGFTDNINRDVTKTQEPQYERKVEKERKHLTSTFEPILRRKAQEFGYSEAEANSVSLTIEESHDRSPLERDDFDIGDFQMFAQGINTATGGEPQELVSPDELRDMLGLPERDGVDQDDTDGLDEETEEDVESELEGLYDEPSVPNEIATDGGDEVDEASEAE